MREFRIPGARGAWLVGVFMLFMLQSSKGWASTFQLVYDGGGLPLSGPLIADAAGNLYGEGFATTTSSGDVFELPVTSGYTSENVIYQFPLVAYGPSDPSGGLTLTSKNVLLGTTRSGGPSGGGIAFDLGKSSNPNLTVLHDFSSNPVTPPDGNFPASGLVAGRAGHFYGTTLLGGVGSGSLLGPGDGIVYYVNPSVSDSEYTIIHEFGTGSDGVTPSMATLAVDSDNRLYGVTLYGGANNLGTVFTLRYMHGEWNEKILYDFRGGDRLAVPTGNVVLDAQGNLYGCAQGGRHNQGGIFELSAPSATGGSWKESVLYTFGHQRYDPIAANSSYSGGQLKYGYVGCYITRDPASGVIVGTSYAGGSHGSAGTIFTLSPPAEGQTGWSETVGYDFPDQKRDDVGAHPESAPLQVGPTYYGGSSTDSSVYAFTP